MTNRPYQQDCPVAGALDVLGDRWSLLLLRDLSLGPLRFSELLELETGIGPNLLTRRLKALQKAGLVYAEPLPYPARGSGYALTALGHTTEPVLRALAGWGHRVPATAEGRPHPDWDLWRLPQRFGGANRRGVIRIQIPGRAYTLRMFTDRLEVHRKDTDQPDAQLVTHSAGLLAWLRGEPVSPETPWTVSGDRSVLQALAAAVRLDPSAGMV